MTRNPLAGKAAPQEMLVNIDKLIASYYSEKPDMNNVAQQVSFGTSGHRGTSLNGSFTESHILAVTQAICEFRQRQGINGPLFLGKDTHALSAPAEKTALEVLAANEVITYIQKDDGFTPTPVISHSILTFNNGGTGVEADGIVITPSHNPPEDGGFKYNPPNGGPADTNVTKWIQDRANAILKNGNKEIRRIAFEKAKRASTTIVRDFITSYVKDLEAVVDINAIRNSRLKLGVDPLGGASIHYWAPIAQIWELNLEVVNKTVDGRFAFMTVDHDGKIRMDCSSKDAMANLIRLKDSYDIAFGNDPDVDRHGIVTRSVGLMDPNHYLAVCVDYLFTHRPEWISSMQVGKTLVSSSMIDRVAKSIDRSVCEVPVGFKWFVDGLLNGMLGFGGEESAGASFLRRNGMPWSTDKDGIIMDLLAAEILAVTGKDPGQYYEDLTERHGRSYYKRLDVACTLEEKNAFKKMTESAVKATSLAGDAITAKLVKAPGNNEPIGGLKVVTEQSWFAARPSGTENIYKIYCESFVSDEHLNTLIEEAKVIVTQTLAG